MGDDDLTRIKGKHRSDLALEAPLSRGDQRSDTGPAELVDWAWGESPAQATAVEEDEYTFYVRIKVYNAKEWGEFAIIIFFYDYEMTVVTKQRIDLGTLAHGDSARVERELNVENGDDIKFFEIIVERTVSPHRSPSS